ncbi:MAG: hypothetical protein M0036_01865 [Desulfobacteraceae bacterium]|nr:hypothetical protein [Desulfobacteraceae bacterium]
MKPIKIAVATTDGRSVNEHFGKSERFSIYMVGEQVTHLEDRVCEKLSTGDPEHTFDSAQFEKIVGTLKDCQKIYVTEIGKVPEAALKAQGLEVIRCSCPIQQIATCCGRCAH